VVQFSPIVSFAVAAGTPWGIAEPLAELLPGTTSATIAAPTTHVETVGLMTSLVVDQDALVDVEPELAAAADRPLVLAVRDLHRNQWMQRAVDAVRAQRPDAVVVEFGLPYGDEADLCTYGGSRVSGVAAAEYLAGVASADSNESNESTDSKEAH
jgi:beta-N-acetylhexosaminidase